MTKKIAIFGTTPTRLSGPIDDPEWEIWTIGPGGKDHHRWNRLFEIHQEWPEDFKDYLNDLSTEERPVYSVVSLAGRMERWVRTIGKDEAWLKENVKGDFKSNVVIDRDALFEKYSRMWFSSSISYCIAMAIEEGATDIGCWGIDLESGEEYIAQHAGCKFFLDIARLQGINLHFPDGGCGLTRDLNPYPDRYETHLALTFEKKKKWIDQLVADQEQRVEGLKMELARIEGQLLMWRDPENIKRGLEDASTATQMIEQKLIEIKQQFDQGIVQLNHLKGERSATEYFQRMYVWNMTDPGEMGAVVR